MGSARWVSQWLTREIQSKRLELKGYINALIAEGLYPGEKTYQRIKSFVEHRSAQLNTHAEIKPSVAETNLYYLTAEELEQYADLNNMILIEYRNMDTYLAFKTMSGGH